MVELAGTEYHQTRQQQQQKTAVDVVAGALEVVGTERVAEVTTAAAGVAGTLVAQWGHGMAGQMAVTAGSTQGHHQGRVGPGPCFQTAHPETRAGWGSA